MPSLLGDHHNSLLFQDLSIHGSVVLLLYLTVTLLLCYTSHPVTVRRLWGCRMLRDGSNVLDWPLSPNVTSCQFPTHLIHLLSLLSIIIPLYYFYLLLKLVIFPGDGIFIRVGEGISQMCQNGPKRHWSGLLIMIYNFTVLLLGSSRNNK